MIAIGVVAVQPVDVSVNDILALPIDTPVTTPVLAFTVATAVLLLVHVPVPDALVSVVDVPAHVPLLPAIAASAFTVTVVVAVQPSRL